MITSSITSLNVSFEPYQAGLIEVDGGLQSDMFFVAEPLDLDYDEPNAVVAVEKTEFVSMTDAVQCVDLPRETASPPQPEIMPLRQRTAA
jgi:hypothetical protein